MTRGDYGLDLRDTRYRCRAQPTGQQTRTTVPSHPHGSSATDNGQVLISEPRETASTQKEMLLKPEAEILQTQTPFPAAASSSQVSTFLMLKTRLSGVSWKRWERRDHDVPWSLSPSAWTGCQLYRQLECQSQKISEIRPSSSFQTLASDGTGQMAACRSIKTGQEPEAAPFGGRGQEPQVCVQGQTLRRLNGGLGIWLGNQIQSKPVFCSMQPILQRGKVTCPRSQGLRGRRPNNRTQGPNCQVPGPLWDRGKEQLSNDVLLMHLSYILRKALL